MVIKCLPHSVLKYNTKTTGFKQFLKSPNHNWLLFCNQITSMSKAGHQEEACLESSDTLSLFFYSWWLTVHEAFAHLWEAYGAGHCSHRNCAHVAASMSLSSQSPTDSICCSLFQKTRVHWSWEYQPQNPGIQPARELCHPGQTNLQMRKQSSGEVKWLATVIQLSLSFQELSIIFCSKPRASVTDPCCPFFIDFVWQKRLGAR